MISACHGQDMHPQAEIFININKEKIVHTHMHMNTKRDNTGSKGKVASFEGE
jgi:hypothetical protein